MASCPSASRESTTRVSEFLQYGQFIKRSSLRQISVRSASDEFCRRPDYPRQRTSSPHSIHTLSTALSTKSSSNIQTSTPYLVLAMLCGHIYWPPYRRRNGTYILLTAYRFPANVSLWTAQPASVIMRQCGREDGRRGKLGQENPHCGRRSFAPRGAGPGLESGGLLRDYRC